jgi:hypothetical protein
MAIFYSGLFASENVEKLSTSVAAMEQGLPSQESDAQSLYAGCTNDLVAGLMLAYCIYSKTAYYS